MSRRPKKQIPQSAVRPAPKPVKVPLAPKTVWKLLIGGFAGLAVVAAGVWALVARVPERTTMALATAASRAGFVVRQVAITGTVNQPKLSIYREVLSGGSDSMLLLDLPAMQERLRELPWVHDVSIARRWPDRLEITIIERKPAAVWQNQGKLLLIDRHGDSLPSDRLEDFANLPLIVGATANREAATILKLLVNEPQIAERMEAAIWIGERRWDLQMTSGETLSLPEGKAAAEALREFAALDRQTPLLGRGFLRFDLRIPDKMVVRVTDEAGAKVKPLPLPQSGEASASTPAMANGARRPAAEVAI
ncbi:MAG: FtsQ-type POTRA domain-containing protein [Sphingomonadaceae bacterium]